MNFQRGKEKEQYNKHHDLENLSSWFVAETDSDTPL